MVQRPNITSLEARPVHKRCPPIKHKRGAAKTKPVLSCNIDIDRCRYRCSIYIYNAMECTGNSNEPERWVQRVSREPRDLYWR